MKSRLWIAAPILVAAIALLVTVPAWAQQASSTVRVMSFNIRYGTARDGDNHWDRRKEFLIETIRAFNPDLLGTQETLGFQRDYLAEQLNEYAVLGVGRNDGQADGEMMALYYHKRRFEQIEAGHFWLSETPDSVGSKSWDSSLPRMVSWVKLRDLAHPRSLPIAFFNTHFDHQGPTARLESAKLLRQKIISIGANCDVVLTGDFNAAGDSSEPYRVLFADQANAGSKIVDSFRIAHRAPTGREGTFSGFDVSKTSGPRIDWIGVSRGWAVMAAEIDHTAREGRTPSDHFPVTAILRRSESTNDDNGARPPEEVTYRIEKDVEYLAAGRKEKADLYLPLSIPKGKRVPAVVIIHGGGFTGGKKDAARELNIGGVLATHGYVGMSIDYLLSVNDSVTWPQNLHDCKTAVRWLRKNAERLQIDPDHIGAIGGSAGGHLAAMLGLTGPDAALDPPGPYGEYSCRVQCAVDMYGPASLMDRSRAMFGKTLEEAPDVYKQASPISHATADDPPMLILHGTADKTVPVAQSELMASVLKKANIEHHLEIIPDAPHTFHLQPKQQDLRPLVLGFFDRHLQPEK